MQYNSSLHRLIIVLLLIPMLNSGEPAGAQGSPQLRAKADPLVLSATAGGQEAEFIVYLAEQADLSAASKIESRLAKGRFVYEQLTETAARTQPQLRRTLESLDVAYRPFWIANMIWVRADRNVAEALAARPEVARLLANPSVRIEPLPAPAAPQTEGNSGVEWNIAKINAPEVWAQGYQGQGVVVAGQDTGFEWQHPALRQQYRGWNGGSADHNYNWHDAVHSGGGICGPDSPEPCDDLGHGTHTMGTMVGDDGNGNRIGVAPDAEWIGCRNMDRGTGTPATYSECFQWFVAPTDLNSENPDVSKAPHVINNSWACPPSEGCSDPTMLQTVVENARAAGIMVVTSAGNTGPSCSTVQYAPAIYDGAFSIGATTSDDTIAAFSSRGPVVVDGSKRLKPDVVAPGSGIRSSIPGSAYGSMSGTSMASPHVAGLVALLISASPELDGDVEQLESLTMNSALPLTSTQTCNGLAGTEIPNHTYGYGRVDALAAYHRLNSPLEYHFFLPLLTEEQTAK